MSPQRPDQLETGLCLAIRFEESCLNRVRLLSKPVPAHVLYLVVINTAHEDGAIAGAPADMKVMILGQIIALLP